MGNHGFKVSQPGYDVKTATPSQLVFSSKYQTLKVQQQGSGSITHSGGRTATIAHNLGYVPMFLVHSIIDPVLASAFGSATDYFISPFRYPIGACHVDRDVIAWADSSNIYIKVRPDFGWYYAYTGCQSVNYFNQTTSSEYPGSCYIGQMVTYHDDGAFRFLNVSVDRGVSIYSARLGFHLAYRNGDDVINSTMYGIDEDNTSPFEHNPFGRNKTVSKHDTCPSDIEVGQWWDFGVTELVQPIINRGGWVSGNAMGFLMFNDGTPTGNYIGNKYSNDCGVYCSHTYLKILKSNALMNYKYTIYLNEVDP